MTLRHRTDDINVTPRCFLVALAGCNRRYSSCVLEHPRLVRKVIRSSDRCKPWEKQGDDANSGSVVAFDAAGADEHGAVCGGLCPSGAAQRQGSGWPGYCRLGDSLYLCRLRMDPDLAVGGEMDAATLAGNRRRSNH